MSQAALTSAPVKPEEVDGPAAVESRPDLPSDGRPAAAAVIGLLGLTAAAAVVGPIVLARAPRAVPDATSPVEDPSADHVP